MADRKDVAERIDEAMKATAPGTALRNALDMILAAHLGALICIGDSSRVLALGTGGFPLEVAFTANRLFELTKMDGAIIVDGEVTTILGANVHLDPDPHMSTSETGMRHRTAARMSMATDAIVIAVSARRSQVSIYVDGRSFRLRDETDLMSEANQLVVSLQAGRDSLDGLLTRLTALEFDDFVTVTDLTRVLGGFQLLIEMATQLGSFLPQLGCDGKLVRRQLEHLMAGVDKEYTLTVRDYATNNSVEEAANIRRKFATLGPDDMSSVPVIARILGYDGVREDSVVTSLGLRALTRASALPMDEIERIAGAYGSLPALMDDVREAPVRLEALGVRNVPMLANGLWRLWGKKG